MLQKINTNEKDNLKILSEKENKYKIIQNDYNILSEEKKQKEFELLEANTTIKTLTKEKNELKEKNKKLYNEKNTLNNQINLNLNDTENFQKKIAELLCINKDLTISNNDLNEQIKTLNKTLNANKNAREKYETELKEKNMVNSNYQQLISANEIKINELLERVDELNKSNIIFQEKIGAFTTKDIDQCNKINNLTSENKKLNDDYKKMENNKNKEINILKEEIKKIKFEINENINTNRNFDSGNNKTQNDELTVLKKNYKLLNDEKVKLKADILELKAEFKMDKNEYEKKIVNLEKQLESKNNLISEIKNNCNNNNNNNDMLIINLRKKNNEIQNENILLKDEIKKQNDDLDVLNNKLINKEKQLNQLKHKFNMNDISNINNEEDMDDSQFTEDRCFEDILNDLDNSINTFNKPKKHGKSINKLKDNVSFLMTQLNNSQKAKSSLGYILKQLGCSDEDVFSMVGTYKETDIDNNIKQGSK